jgi:CHASE3 domain sensor protein
LIIDNYNENISIMKKRISHFVLLVMFLFLRGSLVLWANSYSDLVGSDTFVIAGSQDVADVALRGNDFGDWNYGRGILLEA